MTRARQLFVVDAFSDRPFCGNPAVIVPDAEGMSDRAMQALAAELRMEAGFVLPPTSEGADLRMRFFSPGAEVDVSGHVTVATYAALQAAGKLPGGAAPGPRRIRQQARAGVMPVDLTVEHGAAPSVTLDLGKPVFGAALDRGEVMEALRVGAGALSPGPSPRVVTCGVSLAIANMADSAALAATVPDMARLAGFSRRRGVLGIVAFAMPGLHPQSALTSRFFFPAVGPDEDPVSGAALAAVVAYGVRERLLTCVGEATFLTDQGHSLGRPNRAHVEVATSGGQIAAVRVRGRGVVVMHGEFTPAE
jgi:trans-2,3-dihydro-3-hydroxyanthranilate isomerase